MMFPIQVRGFRPRPWKTKAGQMVYSGTFIVLDMSERPVMETLEMESEFSDEASMVKANLSVGKQAQAIVEGFKVGIDGSPRFTGKIEAVKQ